MHLKLYGQTGNLVFRVHRAEAKVLEVLWLGIDREKGEEKNRKCLAEFHSASAGALLKTQGINLANHRVLMVCGQIKRDEG